MRVAVHLAALGAVVAVAGCNEQVMPAGLTPAPASSIVAAPYDEAAEARVLTNACINAELRGVDSLASLPGAGYAYVKGFGDEPFFVKMGPRGSGLTAAREIALRKPNNDLSCTIHVMPYTHGGAVLAVAKDELERQGWRQVPTARGSADWFAKDGQTLSVLGWVPGQNRKLMTGAEVAFARITS